MMKKISLLVIFASITVFGCNAKNETPDKESKAETVQSSSSNSDTEKASVISAKLSDEKVGTIKLTKKDFLEKIMDYENNQEWIYKGDKPAIIDFYADWCGPCRKAAPVLEELAKEYHGQIYIYKIDTQVEQELAAVFGIQGIPAFLWIPQEGRPTMSSGIAQTSEDTKKMFKQMIDELLLGEKTPAQP